MFNFQSVVLENLVVHHVGNKSAEEGTRLSTTPVALDEAVADMLVRYFLHPFRQNESFYQFDPTHHLQAHPVFPKIADVFEDPSRLFEVSTQLAELLYEASTHPKVKAGELYVVFFSNVLLEDEMAEAVGIFKSENKETYLRVFAQDENFGVQCDTGININRLDKGCLILNTEKEKGYKICIVDQLSKAGEAQYWKDDFLGLQKREDNFYHTQTFMQVCKGFVEEVFNQEHQVDKAEQIEMLNRQKKFFAEREKFDIRSFEETVMQEPQVIDAFQQYRQEYEQKHDVQTVEEFDISPQAVKTTQKQFKSVLKLDKNFHVYIHGNRDKLLRGYDEERGLHYYQLFFEQEA